jgi:hypothetical protein
MSLPQAFKISGGAALLGLAQQQLKNIITIVRQGQQETS